MELGLAKQSTEPTGRYRHLWREAVRVLDENWAGDHTLPSHLLYPHQWSWDAGFIAVGLARYAPERGWRDLRSLFEAQWPDGRVPHIVFDPGVAERDYFPGPAFWQAPLPTADPRQRHTTGVIQPPVHVLAAWRMYRTARAAGAAQERVAREELRWLYPRFTAQQRYLARHRDFGGGGLASIVHPWESGLDNSPSWDEALSHIPADRELLNRHHRRDIAVAAAAHRPTDDDYARFIAIAESYRAGGYSDDGLAERHPFLVECPSFNAISGAAEEALADIAELVDADPAPHRKCAVGISKALVDRLYDAETGMFHALDVRTGRRTPKRCVSGLLPLVLANLPAEQAATVVEAARSPWFGLAESMELPLPSYDRTAPDFDPLRYWRGPVWINVNWLLWQGLWTHGHPRLANALRSSMLRLIDRSGCFEYFSPVDGEGIGSPAFSWTAALALDLLSGEAPDGFPEAPDGSP
jgi:hypothetical protein